MTRIDALFYTFLALQLLDYVTTKYIRSIGGREANPIILKASSVSGLSIMQVIVLFKLVVIGVACYFKWVNSADITLLTLYLLNALYLTVVVSNIIQTIKQRRINRGG